MSRIEEAITIRAPVSQVFAAATDPKRSPEWSPRIVEIRDVSPYPVREGTTWTQTAGMGGQTATMQCRIVKMEPPTMGVLEISGGGQQGRLTTECVEVADGTRLTQTVEFEVAGGFKARMMAAAAGPILQREMSGALQRMRETLEQEAGGGHGSRTA